MIFETLRIYATDPFTGDVDERFGNVTPYDIEDIVSIDQALHEPLHVIGVHASDFMISMVAIDQEGVSQIDYLIHKRNGKIGADLIPSNLVADNPEEYMSTEMATDLKKIHPYELEEFCTSAIINYLHRHYED